MRTIFHKFTDFSDVGISMIWRFACTAPQIHVISPQGCSRSRINTVMNACVEAKEAGISLKLDYFLVGTEICYTGAEVIGTIKNYVNLDVDTICKAYSHTNLLFLSMRAESLGAVSREIRLPLFLKAPKTALRLT